MIEKTVDRDVPGGRREPLLGGHLPERRQGDPLLPRLRLGGDDREHRAPGQEAGHQARSSPARPAASARRTCSSRSARSTRRTRTCPTRPTPTTGPASRARRASASSTSARCSARTTRCTAAAPSSGWAPGSTSSESGSRRGHHQGLRHRDRVRDPLARARAEPHRRLVGAGQRLRGRRRAADRLGLRGRDAGQRRPRLRPGGVAGAHGRDPPGQHGAHQRGPLLRRPRPPRVLDAPSA